jgi:hypothetical protein
MEELELLTDPIKTAATRVIQDELSWTEGYGRIQRFFEKVRLAGLRILFILDEFDHARFLFKGDISGFQGLRELSYRPEWRVTFITASRRSLRDIELQTKAISTFDLIFHKHYLGMFTEPDIEEYFYRIASVGINISPLMKDRIYFYCGGHPYLLEMIAYEIVELFREKHVIDVDQSAKQIEHSFLAQYDHMIGILREDGSLNKMIQILFGPVVDANQTDVDEFLGYGLIHITEHGNYSALSAHFETYLKLIARQIDLWPVWRDAEMALRRVVTATMIERYGENWVEKLLKVRPHLKSIFDKCLDAQQKEEKSFGSRASHNLIDFTYPQDLFDIIFTEWVAFKPLLGKDKGYWSQRSQMLAKIRNPLAHNRDEALAEYERRIAEGYCMEITSLLNEKNNNAAQPIA